MPADEERRHDRKTNQEWDQSVHRIEGEEKEEGEYNHGEELPDASFQHVHLLSVQLSSLNSFHRLHIVNLKLRFTIWAKGIIVTVRHNVKGVLAMKKKGALAASLLATGIILGACGGADEEPMNNEDTEMQEDMDEEEED